METIETIIQWHQETFPDTTLEEQAKESLIYKISNRDTTPYKPWKLTDTKTKEELIKAYRVYDGAYRKYTKRYRKDKG